MAKGGGKQQQIVQMKCVQHLTVEASLAGSLR